MPPSFYNLQFQSITKKTNMSHNLIHVLVIVLVFQVSYVFGDCTCDSSDSSHDPKHVTLKYKLVAFAAILLSGSIGVSLPILGKTIPALKPESNLFYLVKTFAAGVILSTGFIHVLPDAFEDLTSPCLNGPWQSFPFTGLAAMVGALGTLMIDSIATGHYTRAHFAKNKDSQIVNADEEINEEAHADHVHLHTHATHGHSHGPITGLDSRVGSTELDRIRYRITSQVLELGIIVHSVIIGISLGTSESLSTIKPLMAALCFHQCFEGMGLGGCIAQAGFKSMSTICMGLFFSLTTPVGILVGIGIMKTYDDNSQVALIVQGLLNACAAGILIYMALVDLLAQDFMSMKLQSNRGLFLGANVSLLLGAALMSILAIWA